MAAYAALVSLMHIIDQIQHHPRPPFYLDNKHAQSLIQNVTLLQKFLEDYSHVRNEDVDRLESRITEAAYAAEDLIETHIVDQILAQSAQHGKRICSVDFYQDLLKVIQDTDFIKNEIMEIKEKIVPPQDNEQHTRSSTSAAGSSASLSMGQNNMVGRDDVLNEMVDKLTRQQHSNLQVFPIIGMGGIGKTTLAKNVYENPLIAQHFYIRAWATISQEYSIKKILLDLLLCLDNQDSRGCLSEKSVMELRDRLYKSLSGRRYLIILDDIWNSETWDKVKFLLPNDSNGSRLIITTRLSTVASDITGGDKGLEMNFLDDDMSWNLLCKTVFGEDSCPLELEQNGKKIVKSCNGLPLPIVVTGGLLAKSEKTPKYWEYIAENLNSLEEKESCLNLLYTSYSHLPVHLKPCFLYMGIFVEDIDISVKSLIIVWIAEGFLKPISGKSLEEIGDEYFKDLVDRNLILVGKRNHNGVVESCKIHDMLRDLSLRESQKDRFLLVTKQHSLNHSSQDISTQRRVAVYRSTSKEENQCYLPQSRDALQSASFARSLICNNVKIFPFPNCKLLRFSMLLSTELSKGDGYSLSNYIFQQVNLRLIAFERAFVKSCLPSSIYLFWNLQAISFAETEIKSFAIWKMPLLRAVAIKRRLHLVNPGHDGFVLGSLHLLKRVANFRCSEKVVKKIPNIKELEIVYDERFIGFRYCLNNLVHLHKLEILSCCFKETPCRGDLLQNLTFPHCLKELTLKGCHLHWEDISTKIGSLPHLQVLRLKDESFIGPEWETIEGQFSSLEILKIKYFSDLKCWKTDSAHFPCLKRLVLAGLDELEEIPSPIGDIPTLQLIKLTNCSYPAIISAMKIAKEQEELENPDLHVLVHSWRHYEEMKASPNFEVVCR